MVTVAPQREALRKAKVKWGQLQRRDNVALADADVVEVGGDVAGGVMDVGVGEGGADVSVDEAWAVMERWRWVEMVVRCLDGGRTVETGEEEHGTTYFMHKVYDAPYFIRCIIESTTINFIDWHVKKYMLSLRGFLLS